MKSWSKVNQLVESDVTPSRVTSHDSTVGLPLSWYQRHWMWKHAPACWVQLFFFFLARAATTHLQAAAPLTAHLLKEGLLFPRTTYKKSKGADMHNGPRFNWNLPLWKHQGMRESLSAPRLNQTANLFFLFSFFPWLWQNLNLASCVFLIAEHVLGAIASTCSSYLLLDWRGPNLQPLLLVTAR